MYAHHVKMWPQHYAVMLFSVEGHGGRGADKPRDCETRILEQWQTTKLVYPLLSTLSCDNEPDDQIWVYLMCWSCSGPGYYTAIHVSLRGEWHRDVNWR